MSFKNLAFDLKFGAFDKSARQNVRELRRHQSQSAEELEAINWNRRVKLVNFCATAIPFYKKKLKLAGFQPGDLKTEKDYQSLPVLEKNEIRQSAAEIVNPRFRLNQLPVSTTGGTTGIPLKIYNDPRTHLSSISWRMLDWWELSPSDNSGYLYRAVPTGPKRFLSDIALYPTRRIYISAADMTQTAMDNFYYRLIRAQPKYLVGYVGAIDAFAHHLNGIEKYLPSLKAVWTTSAPLLDQKRRFYERVFQCPTYTQYGSCEFYWIAAECKRKCGLHIGSDVRHVDVVEQNHPVSGGEFGDLIVTDLLNYAFPLLRYRLGDRGRLLQNCCSCGLPFPMMDYVKGRISDAIHMKEGSTIPGEYWTTIFDDFSEEIGAFQVYQHKDYTIEVRYERNQGLDPTNAVSIVSRRLNDKLQGRTSLKFVERVLTPVPSEKH